MTIVTKLSAAIRGLRMAAAIGLACCLGATAASAQKSDVTLRVAAFGGPFSEAMQKFTVDIFTRYTGIKVEFTYANPSDFLAQLIAARGRPVPYDVVCMDDDVALAAARAGVTMKLDPAIVTNLQFLYPEALSKDGHGPALFFFALGIAYHKDKLKQAGIPEPTSWADLFDPRLAGRVAIPDIASIQGKDFIVQMARLNGGSEAAPEKGVEKIGEIKAHSYFVASSTVQAQFEAGDVWMAPWNTLRAWSMIDRGVPMGFVVPKEGSIGNTDTIEVVAGTPYPKEAQLFVNYALDPFAQLGMTKYVPNGPSNKLLTPVIAAYPDVAKKGPTTPEELAKLYLPDWTVFNGNLKKVNDLWNRTVHK